jgi:glycosyltransferase involved in cell wall biosynthesis
MAERKSNVYKTVLISNEQRNKWISAGGDENKSIIISNPVFCPKTSLKYKFDNKFVYGLHQRSDESIFSHIPLEAYKKIESDSTMFLLLGGSNKHKQQASNLGIKNIQFIPTTPDLLEIHKFLNSLNVYAHGRADGEQCSTAIIEAMSHGLPIVSHFATSNGHVEQISNAGKVVNTVEEYSNILLALKDDKRYYDECSKNCKIRYENEYSIDAIMNKYCNLFKEATQKNN